MLIPEIIDTKQTKWYRRICMLSVFFIITVIAYYINLFGINTYSADALLMIKANKATEQHDFGESEILYKAALHKKLYLADLKFNLANSYFGQGRYGESIVIYDSLQAVSTGKYKAQILNNLGSAYYFQGLISQSFDAFKKALIINDSDSVIRRNFIYVNTFIQRLNSKRNVSPNTKDKRNDKQAKQDKEQSKNREANHSRDEQANQSVLADKEMDDLLKLQEMKAKMVKNGTKSMRSKLIYSNGPDY